MQTTYLGLVPFSLALQRQEEVLQQRQDTLLGFESEPVITLGVRGSEEDIQWSSRQLASSGITLSRLDRGGQATLHHPGQLVIFPVVGVRAIGAKRWVDLLLKVTRETLRAYGKETVCRPGQPGLYSDSGKVASIGVRIKNGISTHGIAINVRNNLGEFACIRPCGVLNAPMDRLGGEERLESIFTCWVRNFELGMSHELTSSTKLTNLECSKPNVRS